MSRKYIKMFTFENMNRINTYINSKCNDFFIKDQIQDLLSTENINFTLVNINRLQSTLICELGLSYVQQSQRYVPVNKKYINYLTDTPSELLLDAEKLVNYSIDLYNEMTELKDNTKKGRLTTDDFVNGIPYEDARYILPLCVSTNIVICTTADKLIDLFALFNTYPIVFSEIKQELMKILPSSLLQYIHDASLESTNEDYKYSDDYFKYKINDLTLDDNVILLDTSDNIKHIAIGALASQNSCTPSEKYNSWQSPDEESKKLISNVLSYGHTGILEHGRTTFAMECSLSTYHQVIRHRLQNIRRESLTTISYYENRDFYVPTTIRNNHIYNKKVKSLIDLYVDFYTKHAKHYSHEFIMQFALNATCIKFVVSSNLRNDNWIFRERLCYTAQEEIRNLYLKKFDVLYDFYPEILKNGLPPCVTTGKCKEGKLTCSKHTEVKEKYSKYI